MKADESEPDDSTGIGADDGMPEGTAHHGRSWSDSSHRAGLISTVEGEIVPRLLMLCRSAGPATARGGGASTATDPGDVE
jgi:hypothetical protein